MYAMIRRYHTRSVDETINKIRREFLSVITSAPGFITYYVVDEGNGIQSSISIFETREYAEYSNKLASYWVKENASFLLNSPEYASGEVLICQRKEDGPVGTGMPQDETGIVGGMG
ncbi:MAG: hypothetical protein OEW39_09405 [Deltaproteobacteria bacterium]|nr:hypothetical protein [Deltaproteobacteria bacterium]